MCWKIKNKFSCLQGSGMEPGNSWCGNQDNTRQPCVRPLAGLKWQNKVWESAHYQVWDPKDKYIFIW